MKIGILNSDTVKIDGAAEFGQYPEMFSMPFHVSDPFEYQELRKFSQNFDF